MSQYSTLIPRTKVRPKDPLAVVSWEDYKSLPWPEPGELVAFDFEASGVEAQYPDFYLAGLSIAWGDGNSWYVDLRGALKGIQLLICAKLRDYRLVAHNISFDISCLRHLGLDIYGFTYEGCTYGLFKQLSSEGWEGQSWGLKNAQMEVLQWEIRGDEKLKEWLVSAGHVDKSGNPLMGRMALAPLDVIGPYGCLDTQSCLFLWRHLVDCAKKTPGGKSSLAWHQTAWMTSSVLLDVERQFRGMYVPTDEINAYYTDLTQRIEDQERYVKNMPECKPHLDELHQRQIDQVLSEEPEKFTKTGKVAANWTKWTKRVENARAEVDFNIRSGPQKEWLFFDKMGYEPKIITEKGTRSTNKKVLPWLGPVGMELVKYNKLNKEKSYVKPCRQMSEDGSGYIYPMLNSNGTLTHRMAGGGGKAARYAFNLQQQPKVYDYMKCYKARPGHAIVHFDFPSLENRILADASRDPNLLKLYGPGQPKNCGYLFLAANVPGLDKVRELYDPDNPVNLPEIKKKYKKERGIAKEVELKLSFGAGVAGVQLGLALEGFPMEFDEVKEIVDARKKLYAKVQDFEQDLLREWNSTGGYIYDAFGCPHPIDGSNSKDVVNRFTQTSGHKLLTYLNTKIDQLRNNQGVEMYPWIPDFHDECMYEVPETQVQAAKELIEEAVRWVDTEVNLSDVSYLDEVEVHYNLGEIKCED